MVKPNIYQLKVTLQDFRPPIWRRLLIFSNATFFDLHSLIQDAFTNWIDYHLHDFRAQRNKGKKIIYIKDLETMDDWSPTDFLYGAVKDRDEYLDEYTTKLQEYLSKDHPRLLYDYDFGDGWQHEILLEKTLNKSDVSVPAVIAGKRNGPPEDSRGWVHEADKIVKASKDKSSVAWKKLVRDWGKEDAEDIAEECAYFLYSPFDLDEIEITDPKERKAEYDKWR